MKNYITLAITFLSIAMYAQDAGSIVGKLTDKDANDEPLPFANVIIKGTSTGTTSDFDGLYAIENLVAGDYVIEVSFVGYETIEVPATVIADKVTTVNIPMGASAAALDEVVITTSIRRESQVALLLEQKKATTIKESIGSEQLAKLGVSDAAAATTKISGISKTDGTGDVFVRGLGDRYLYTTLNGLPIPSDDIERKNIDLGLFTTRLIESIDVSKTTSARLSADQASGNIDISSKSLSGSKLLSIGVSGGTNTNVISNGVFGNFKVSPNNDNVTAGFYSKDLGTREALTNESWNPNTISAPINRSVSISAGTKIGEKLKVLATIGQSSKFDYREGVFREFRGNFIDDSIPDAITWKKTVATSGLLNGKFRANDNHSFEFTTLLINKVEDQVFEGGRAGTATIFEETNEGEAFQFIRDQNVKNTLTSITQLIGKNKFTERNTLDWGIGYNYLSADEPNRIRNEVNFNFAEDPDLVQLGRNGGFQQRKSIQKIEDIEYNGRINDEFYIVEGDNSFKIDFGGTYRNKERNFGSQFFGIEETVLNAVNPTSIDHISEIFTEQNIANGLLKVNTLPADRYRGNLESIGGYFEATGVTGKFTVQGGLRYQDDQIDVTYDVGNIPGRLGEVNKSYRRVYPSVNLKYAASNKFNVRFANSYTTTLPEFKEIAPFEYVSQVGQVTRGNTSVEASLNANYDLKFEYFPSSGQLLSITGFYKDIEDPINKVQDRGASGAFSYFNTSDNARIYGIEIEGRVKLIDGSESETANVDLNVNASRMWHKQDLREIYDAEGNFVNTFRYKGITEVGLQGASDWIVNTSISYDTNTEKPLVATIAGNYASDRIFALGNATIRDSGDINYNDAIIENGFVMLDLTVTKELSEKLTVGFVGKNLFNPEIKRTQLVRNPNSGIETNETVLSYSRGSQLGLNLKYTF
ncbi:TonB-dependent receptor [Patiriisocius marinus]|uniref:TonB-dependent receptor n=1 Tax=Patiriisocius marinus TaxID=1397112 RepID=UPI00232BF65E|nr:TonB-dependent receptor [Patiriisocius marinus]